MAREALRILTQLPRERLERIATDLPWVELVEVPTEGELAAGIHGQVLLTMPWGSPNLASVVERGVRWVHAVGTGVDRFPFDALLPGQRLTCSRGASAVPIAEWVMAMVLAAEKQLPGTWIEKPPPRWSQAQLGTLEGKTLALLGLGSIGEAVARRALPFGMRVRALRRTPTPSPVEGVEMVTELQALLAAADHLVLALPATPATRQVIGGEALSHVKHGVHLVNVSRGSLVDQEALRAALDDGRVSRASLDTVDPEPLPAKHWLYAHPKVFLSPHVSWSMEGYFDVFLDIFAQNLRRYRRGEPLIGEVDLVERY
jgi:phosphoglycerate dehydrogenase-like enzyme